MKESEPLPKTWGKPVIKHVGYSSADSCIAYACEKGIYIENTFESCEAPSMFVEWYELAEYLPSDLMHNELLDRMRKEYQG